MLQVEKQACIEFYLFLFFLYVVHMLILGLNTLYTNKFVKISEIFFNFIIIITILPLKFDYLRLNQIVLELKFQMLTSQII